MLPITKYIKALAYKLQFEDWYTLDTWAIIGKDTINIKVFVYSYNLHNHFAPMFNSFLIN